MKKLIILTTLIVLALTANAQVHDKIDTIYFPAGTDTLYHFNGYTDNIVGWMIDCRDLDDTTGVRFSVGTGWAAYDTTFIQFESINLPATITVANDYLVGFEKKGVAFPLGRIQITRGSAGTDQKVPIRITYDR